MEVLLWLRKNNYVWECRICSTAARGGHLEVLKYTHKYRCHWDEHAVGVQLEEDTWRC